MQSADSRAKCHPAETHTFNLRRSHLFGRSIRLTTASARATAALASSQAVTRGETWGQTCSYVFYQAQGIVRVWTKPLLAQLGLKSGTLTSIFIWQCFFFLSEQIKSPSWSGWNSGQIVKFDCQEWIKASLTSVKVVGVQKYIEQLLMINFWGGGGREKGRERAGG